MPGREAWAKEMELAEKALELDPNLAEAHLSMGTALFSVLGPHASEKELDRAVELNPNLALIYDQYGWTFSAMGRFDDAIAAEKKALELDPLNTFLNTDLAFFFTGRAVSRMRLRKSARPWNWILIMVSPTRSWAGA